MEYVTIIMAIIEAIRECMRERREDQIVDALMAPGLLERLMIRVSIRRSGVRGRKNRQLAFDGVIARMQSATRTEMAQFVWMSMNGSKKQRDTLAREVAATMPQ
jgi:hypothetical protein